MSICCNDLVFATKESLYASAEVCAKEGFCEKCSNRVTEFLYQFGETVEDLYEEARLRNAQDEYIAWYPGY